MSDYKGYARVKNVRSRRLLMNPIIAIGSHWFFQSLLYMDWSERLFKIVLDLGLTLAAWLVLRGVFDSWAVWVAALVLAHTLNFVFNAHLWGILKFYGFIHQTHERFSCYVDRLKIRVKREPSIQKMYLCGSTSLGMWTPASDLDIRVLRRTGWVNGLRACTFAVLERSRAFFAHFPLDLYVLDSITGLEKMHEPAFPIEIE